MTLRLIPDHQRPERRAIVEACRELIAFNGNIHFDMGEVALKAGHDPDTVLRFFPNCKSIVADIFHDNQYLVTGQLRALLSDCTQVGHYIDSTSQVMDFFLSKTNKDEIMSPIWKHYLHYGELHAVHLQYTQLNTLLMVERLNEIRPDLCRYEAAMTLWKLQDEVLCNAATELQDASPRHARFVARETRLMAALRMDSLLKA